MNAREIKELESAGGSALLHVGLCFSESEGCASRSQNSGAHPGGPGGQSEADLGASFLCIRKLLLPSRQCPVVSRGDKHF